MDARVDFDKYAGAVSRAHNVICLPQGGLTACPGTRFIKATKNGAARLIGFEPVADASYMIEAGNGYLRFFKNQGLIVSAETDAAITNGTFDSDISGWTDSSTGGGAVSHNGTLDACTLSATQTGYSGIRQSVSVGASYQSAVHVLRFQLRGRSFASASARVGTSSGAADLALAENLGIGWHTIAFTPGTGTIHVEFRNKENFVIYVDDIEFLSDEAVEIMSPYSAEEVSDIRASQSADVMYLFHPDHPVQKLQRRGDSAWSLVETFFEDGPYLGVNPGIDLGEANLIANFDFESGSVGWSKAATGTGYIDYDSAQQVVFLRRRSPIDPSSASDYNGTAEIRHQTTTTNSAGTHVLHFQIVGGGLIAMAVGTTANNDDIVSSSSFAAGWYSVEFTPGATTFYVRFTGDQDLEIIGGVGACYCYQSQARLLRPGAATGSTSLGVVGSVDDLFAPTDVGRLIRLEWPGREPGYAMITAYSSATSVTVQVLRKLPETTPTETWSLGAWSDTTGYPRTGTFFQQRLFAGRSATQPQTIWASQGGGGYESMRPDSWVAGATTVEADDAINVTLASKRISPINWMVGTRRLLVGTASGNWAFDSQGAAISPIDISVEQHTSVDCADIEPIQIDDVGIYVHRAKRSVYDIGFSYEIEGFRASDLTILAEHVTKSGIEHIGYQAEPFSLTWARLSDGTMACMTYKRSQGVVGWTTREISGGEVVSLATIPGSASASEQVYSSLERDELWLVVKRTVDGNEVHYIEIVEGFFDGPNRARYLSFAEFQTDMRTAQTDAFHVDCGLTYQGASADTLSGLDHLEGETVKVVVDGAVQQDKVVSGGQITLDQAGLGETMTAHVGLGYDWIIRGLKLPYGAQAGTGVAKTKTINRLGLVLRDSASFQYGIEYGDRDATLRPQAFRKASMPMSEAVPLFTGETVIDLDGGYDTDPRIVLKGDLPLPFTLLGIAPQQKTNEQL